MTSTLTQNDKSKIHLHSLLKKLKWWGGQFDALIDTVSHIDTSLEPQVCYEDLIDGDQ